MPAEKNVSEDNNNSSNNNEPTTLTKINGKVGKVAHEPRRPTRPELIPVSVA